MFTVTVEKHTLTRGSHCNSEWVLDVKKLHVRVGSTVTFGDLEKRYGECTVTIGGGEALPASDTKLQDLATEGEDIVLVAHIPFGFLPLIGKVTPEEQEPPVITDVRLANQHYKEMLLEALESLENENDNGGHCYGGGY